jgi:hypothetical protein
VTSEIKRSSLKKPQKDSEKKAADRSDAQLFWLLAPDGGKHKQKYGFSNFRR